MRFIFLFLALLLAACSATTGGSDTTKPTEYLYAPPLTAGGRLCIIQCQQARAFCTETCDHVRVPCMRNNQQTMIRDYEVYAREQAKLGQKPTLEPSAFLPADTCGSSKCADNCATAYRRCYAACGGKVTEAE